MSSIPSWKQALLDRKKKQEDEEKAKSEEDKKAKLASLPAWKRAIVAREKPITTTSSPSIVQSAATTSNKRVTQDKWQVAVKRVKGPDSPILNQKQPWARTTSPLSSNLPTSTSSSSSSLSSLSSSQDIPKRSSQSFSGGSKTPIVNRWNNVNSTSEASVYNKPPSNVSSNTRFLSSNTRSVSSNALSVSLNTRSNTPSVSSRAQSSAPTPDDDDPSLTNLPPWKKALILKKRAAQNRVEVKPEGTDEIDSGLAPPSSPPPSPSSQAALPTQPASTQLQSSMKPEVVNREGSEASNSHRLIEQEGITLHPPVYKEVDQWANVNEEDKKFKDLPLWKQALIKRRRADIANRSGLPMTVSPTLPPPVVISSEPDSERKTTTNIEQQTSAKSRTANARTSKKIFSGKSVTNRKNGTKSHGEKESLVKATTTATTTTTTTNKNLNNIKPYRKAPLPPVEKEEEPMFTYNFKKSSSPHHTLDTGNTSSDSTDSDLEDAIITNLDESSDEGDSGIVLQSYTSASKSSSSSSTADMKQKASEQSVPPLKKNQTVKPALSHPHKKKKHLRRVSWSDSLLVSEHFYPKYDYSDYDESDQMPENEGLSHRLHPSLRSSNDTNSDLYHYGYNASSPSNKSSSEGSFTNFVPSSLSSYSPRMLSGFDDISVDEPIAEVDVVSPARSNTSNSHDEPDTTSNDFYHDVDLTSNTAALLW